MTDAKPYAQASDEDLLSWSGDGDRAASDQIVLRHGPFALRVAARLLLDSSVAEDVVQESMVRAWSRADEFDARRASFTTWLYRIVVNLCLDQRRRKSPLPLPDSFAEQMDPSAGLDEHIEADQRRLALARTLGTLPAKQRAVIALVYQEGLSGAETARILGISPKAVERLLARARHCLRGQLSALE